MANDESITTTSEHSELFNPSDEVVNQANIRDYDALYKKSIEDREGFCAYKDCCAMPG